MPTDKDVVTLHRDWIQGLHRRWQRTFRAAGVLTVLGTVSGCAVVPGVRMADGPDERLATEAGEASDFDVEITEIDAEVISEQQPAVSPALELGETRSREEITQDYQYEVGAGDVLNIIVWGHEELTNPFGAGSTSGLDELGRVVREDGKMFFPFVGLLDVEGRNVEEIRRDLQQRLQPYVSNPQVAVRVVGFHSKRAYVTGQVREPGTLQLRDTPMTVMDAINQAGGFSEEADRRRAVLTRGDQQYEIDILRLYATGSNDMLLRDNDVLHIPDNHENRVFMIGELEEQIAVPLKDGQLTLAEAIAEVEGVNLASANTAELYVIRGLPVHDDDGELLGIRPKVYQLDAREAPALLLADGFELQPRDVVFVAASPLVRFNRVVAQYTPIIQALWQTDRIIRD